MPRTDAAWRAASEAARAEAEAIAEDVAWLLRTGVQPDEVARRVGYERPGSLARRLDRNGRRELARPFWAADHRLRRSA